MPGPLGAGRPAGLLTGNQTGPHGRQVSPDKDMNFRCTIATFTVSPEPKALKLTANPLALHSGK